MFFQFHLGLLPLNLLSILDPIILQRLQPKSKLSLQPYCIVVWNVIYLMQWRWWLIVISVPWIIFTFLSTSFLKTTELYIEVRSDRSVVGSGLLTRGATFIECWWHAHRFWGNKRPCSKKLHLKHFNEYLTARKVDFIFHVRCLLTRGCTFIEYWGHASRFWGGNDQL